MSHRFRPRSWSIPTTRRATLLRRREADSVKPVQSSSSFRVWPTALILRKPLGAVTELRPDSPLRAPMFLHNFLRTGSSPVAVWRTENCGNVHIEMGSSLRYPYKNVLKVFHVYKHFTYWIFFSKKYSTLYLLLFYFKLFAFTDLFRLFLNTFCLWKVSVKHYLALLDLSIN